MSVVVTKFGNFQSPNINKLSAMRTGPLAPLATSPTSKLFPHVQTPIGGGGVIRALPVKGNVYASTNNVF